MGLWTQMKASYMAQGVHVGGMTPFNPGGSKAAFRQFGRRLPQEGLLHNMKRGIIEMSGFDNTGAGRLRGGVKYGGGLFSAGGMREISHGVEKFGTAGTYKLGARRSVKGMIGKFAGKAIGPAFFIYQAATEGIGAATRDAALFGSAFGVARWGLGKLGMGLLNPLTLGTAALVGGVIGGRQALIAGREYNRNVRKASFGNAANDMYGNMATMRRASLNAIQNSKLNGRSALGTEASLMHHA